MQSVGLWSGSTLLEVELLLATLVLCSLIGIERQVRQKSAGYRTNVLVGLGSCAFTLVSAHGFAYVLGSDVTLDPSRIAAQIVSGIGFLGAGVIFKGNNVVRGLTTAATVWVSAAVGMACGAGMLSLGVALTLAHLVTLFGIAPIVRRVPTPDKNRVVQIAYRDKAGALRRILALATSMGFAALIDRSRRVDSEQYDEGLIVMGVRFQGRAPLHELIPRLMEVEGVRRVAIEGTEDDDLSD